MTNVIESHRGLVLKDLYTEMLAEGLIKGRCHSQFWLILKESRNKSRKTKGFRNKCEMGAIDRQEVGIRTFLVDSICLTRDN